LIDIRQKAHLGYFENATDLRDKIVTDYVGEGDLNEARMEAEGSRSSAEEVEIDEKKLEQIEWYGKVEIPGEGLIECIVWVEKRTKTFLGIMPLLHLSRKNRRPFVIAQFIRRMNRMYGKTVLEFILEIEKEVNSIHNQRLDAGTMSIVPPLFFTPNSGFSPQDVKLKPGICLPVDDINSVKWMQMPNNVLVSFQEERILMELVEKITSVGSYQSGQQSDVVKSGATARGTLAVIAQGEQRFQTLAKRLQSPISKIQRKLLESYQENIPPGMEKRVLGDDAKPIFPRGLSAEDLVGNFDLIHSVDATGGLKQVKIEMDDQLAAAMAENPIAQQFLMQNIGGAWELIAEPLRNRGKDPEKILGPKPQMPELQQDISQTIRKCISEIKQGRLPKEDTKVNPMQLLTALVAYKTTPEAMGLEPEKQALLELKIEKLRLTLATQMMKQNSMGAVAEGMKNERVGVEGQGPTQTGPAGAGIEPRVAGSPVEAAENEGERVVESGK